MEVRISVPRGERERLQMVVEEGDRGAQIFTVESPFFASSCKYRSTYLQFAVNVSVIVFSRVTSFVQWEILHPHPPHTHTCSFCILCVGSSNRIPLAPRGSSFQCIICSAPQIVKSLTDLSGAVRVIILRSLTVCAPHLLSMCWEWDFNLFICQLSGWYELEVMFGGSQLTHDVAVHNIFINVRVLWLCRSKTSRVHHYK